MGSRWKMPTKEQCQELIDNTNHTWTTINGVNGRKFTSKTDSSKYVFFPAGGFWDKTTLNHATTNGHYWTTKWYTGTSNLRTLDFASTGSSINSTGRWYGLSVRAIQ